MIQRAYFLSLNHFMQTDEGDELIDRYLEYASMKELESSMELNDFMHMAIGQKL